MLFSPTDPSPDPRPLVKARGVGHPLPSERENHLRGARRRPKTGESAARAILSLRRGKIIRAGRATWSRYADAVWAVGCLMGKSTWKRVSCGWDTTRM